MFRAPVPPGKIPAIAIEPFGSNFHRTCHQCKSPIVQGGVRVAIPDATGGSWRFFHFPCWESAAPGYHDVNAPIVVDYSAVGGAKKGKAFDTDAITEADPKKFNVR